MENDKDIKTPTPPPASKAQADAASFVCCGQHAVCEKELLMASATQPIEYFDDEELDRFRGRAADAYSEAEEEEFREVFYTMFTREVPDWLNSLQLRGLELPEGLRDEVLLVVQENQEAASAAQ